MFRGIPARREANYNGKEIHRKREPTLRRLSLGRIFDKFVISLAVRAIHRRGIELRALRKNRHVYRLRGRAPVGCFTLAPKFISARDTRQEDRGWVEERATPPREMSLKFQFVRCPFARLARRVAARAIFGVAYGGAPAVCQAQYREPAAENTSGTIFQIELRLSALDLISQRSVPGSNRIKEGRFFHRPDERTRNNSKFSLVARRIFSNSTHRRRGG